MKKTIFILGSLTIALLPNISCSNLDSDRNVDEIRTETGMNRKQSGELVDPAVIFNAYSAIQKEIENNPEFAKKLKNPEISENGEVLYIDQEMLDHIIETAELQEYADQIDVRTLNNLIAENVKAYKMGYENYFRETPELSKDANHYANEIMFKNAEIKDFENEENFRNLQENERTMLTNINNTATYARGYLPVEAAAGFGAIAGVTIGFWIAGPVGALIGGVVGAIVGALTKV